MEKIKIISFWRKKDTNGDAYLSCELNDNTQLTLMPNTDKKHTKEPDYCMYIRFNNKKEEEPQVQPDCICWGGPYCDCQEWIYQVCGYPE